MVERTPILNVVSYALIAIGIIVVGFPMFVAILLATQAPETMARATLPVLPDGHLVANIAEAWESGGFDRLYLNSFIVATLTAVGKVLIAMISAYGVVFFRFRFRRPAFWLIFASLMIPLEVRIVPTYEVAANVAAPLNALLHLLGFDVSLKVSLLNSYAGLVLPMIATATGTFLFRQFFLTLSDDLVDAARIDGAGALRFFAYFAVPLSINNMLALATVMFVAGWNQYLWPLLITTDPQMQMAILGLGQFLPSVDEMPRWHITMAAVLLVMLPPVLVVAAMMRWFVRGLVHSDK